MEKFWQNISIIIDKNEKPLVLVGLMSLILLIVIIIDFIFINNERNETLFLLSMLCDLVLLFCSNSGFVKYYYFGQYAKIHEANKFMKIRNSLFLFFCYGVLFAGFLLIVARLLKLVL